MKPKGQQADGNQVIGFGRNRRIRTQSETGCAKIAIIFIPFRPANAAQTIHFTIFVFLKSLADAVSKSRQFDELRPLGIVRQQLSIAPEILTVATFCFLQDFQILRQHILRPQVVLFHPVQKLVAAVDEQHGRFGGAVIQCRSGQNAAGDVGLIAVERQHAVDQILLLRLPGPFEHGEDGGNKFRIARLFKKIKSLQNKIAGNFHLVVFMDVKDAVHADGLGVMYFAIPLPDPPVKIQDGFRFLMIAQGQQSACYAVLIPDITQRIGVAGHHRALDALLRFDHHGNVVDRLQQLLPPR